MSTNSRLFKALEDERFAILAWDADLATAQNWLSTTGMEDMEFTVIDTLFEGYMKIISKPWPTMNYGRSGTHNGGLRPVCPYCERGNTKPHSPECTFVIAAKACGAL